MVLVQNVNELGSWVFTEDQHGRRDQLGDDAVTSIPTSQWLEQ